MGRQNTWPLNGYAPGGYACRCIDCEANFEGDKRAIRCLACAVSTLRAQVERQAAELAKAVEALKALRALNEAGGDPFGEPGRPTLALVDAALKEIGHEH